MTSSTGVIRSQNVYPIQVDEIGLQSLQAGFDGLHHALAVIARRIRIIARRSIGIFGG
jgi:hypothetical protein